jgi:cytochrome c oxidase cbb3-type subunit I/II
MFLMAYNLLRTAVGAKAVDGEAKVLAIVRTPEPGWAPMIFSPAVLLVTVVSALIATIAVVDMAASVALAVFGVCTAVLGTIALQLARGDDSKPTWHRLLEGRPLLFTALTLVAVLAGGVAEIVPTVVLRHTDPSAVSVAHPYRPLELEGRDLYLREGCYTCHSQMIRPFRYESQRYGEVSAANDSVFDHPFQWGSKRTGPDLAREGGRNPNLWHYRHMIDPRSTSPGSIMPAYPSLATTWLDASHTTDKMRAMRNVGVPYTDAEIAHARADSRHQAVAIARDLRTEGERVDSGREIVALIAYLQRLGRGPQPDEAPPAAIARVGH